MQNPFSGVKTYDNYKHLWQLTVSIILLQVVLSTIVALAEKHSGLSFSPFEAMIPALLATGWVSWTILCSLGVSLNGALSDWGLKAVPDLKKAFVYFSGYALVICCLFGALLGAYYLLGSGLETAMKPLSDQNGAENGLLKVIAEGSRLRSVLVLFSACVLAPVVEEVFFRRIVYVTIRLKKGFWPSAFWSSLLFSLFHGLAAPVILPVGLYFCWVYERERRLPVNIFLHSLVNLSMIALKVFIA